MDNAQPKPVPAIWSRAFVARAKVAIAREAATLPRTLTSWTFLFFVLTPFCVWSGLLLWLRVPYSAWPVSAIGGDLTLVLFVWTLLAAMWIPCAAGLGRYRHAATVFLALSVITTVRGCLPPLASPSAAHERAADGVPARIGD